MLGWQNSHGSVLVLRDAEPDRTQGSLRRCVRLRYRPRPARHRHQSIGLLPPTITYLAVCIDYLFSNRHAWGREVAVGKTVVSSTMIDRVTARLGRRLSEVPVGFQMVRRGTARGESRICRRSERGLIVSAPRVARCGPPTKRIDRRPSRRRDDGPPRPGPGRKYRELARDLGDPFYERIDAPATPAQKAALAKLSPADVRIKEMAGDKVERILTSSLETIARLGDQGHDGARLVRRAPVRHRRHLQNLRRELPRKDRGKFRPRRRPLSPTP